MVTGSAGSARNAEGFPAGPSRTIDNEDHIKIVIVSPTADTGSLQYEQKMDCFLSALFGTTDQSSDMSSLDRKIKYEGDNKVLVTFRLSSSTASFSESAEKFCTLIFHPGSSDLFRQITKEHLLGLSPAPQSSATFKRHWYRALFREVLKNGLTLLKHIDVRHDEYLPEWALTLCFAIIAQINFAVGTDLDCTEGNAVQLFGTEGVETAERILKKMMDREASKCSTAREKEFRDKFKKCAATVVGAVRSTVDVYTITGSNSSVIEEDLYLSLYNAAHMAACTLTANRGTFDAFLAYRKVAAQQHTGDYLMRASAVLWRKKTGSTKSYGGIITKEYSGTLIRLAEEAPPKKKMHPAWWVATPVVLPFAIAGGVFYGPYKLAQHFSSKGTEAELVRYNELALFVGRVFGLALDIKTLMGCVEFTQGRFKFVDDKPWVEINEGRGKADDVLEYLEQQGKSLEGWRAHLATQL
ncbi:hypothetical protein BDD12DRAFT_861854 [Trichophaea hybrida]|nr:hypothetical protein BDD12DRAFT_861854 [Trichophaea hybrida]